MSSVEEQRRIIEAAMALEDFEDLPIEPDVDNENEPEAILDTVPTDVLLDVIIDSDKETSLDEFEDKLILMRNIEEALDNNELLGPELIDDSINLHGLHDVTLFGNKTYEPSRTNHLILENMHEVFLKTPDHKEMNEYLESTSKVMLADASAYIPKLDPNMVERIDKLKFNLKDRLLSVATDEGVIDILLVPCEELEVLFTNLGVDNAETDKLFKVINEDLNMGSSNIKEVVGYIDVFSKQISQLVLDLESCSGGIANESTVDSLELISKRREMKQYSISLERATDYYSKGGLVDAIENVFLNVLG